MATHHTDCSCGSVKLTINGDPLRISICHCFECQKRTGSTYAMQARFKKEKVSITGHTNCYLRTGDEGTQITFNFCPNCANVIYYVLDSQPEVYAVPVGLLCDPGFPKPNYSVYEERMHHWITLPEPMEHVP